MIRTFFFLGCVNPNGMENYILKLVLYRDWMITVILHKLWKITFLKKTGKNNYIHE